MLVCSLQWRLAWCCLDVLDAETHLPFTSLQDGNNVVICDLTLLGSEHVCGAVADDGQHLVLAQLVGAWIHESSCWTKTRGQTHVNSFSCICFEFYDFLLIASVKTAEMGYPAEWRWSPGAASSRPSPRSSPPRCSQWCNERRAPASAGRFCELGPIGVKKVDLQSIFMDIYGNRDLIEVVMMYEMVISTLLALTMAWRSTWGFQSESYKITTSAVARLMPSPPALVLNMKRNLLLLGSLNALIEICTHIKSEAISISSSSSSYSNHFQLRKINSTQISCKT